MHRNWDDIRFVLAVVEAGSLTGAARKLKVNHATVLRRVNRFEEQSGVVMFERNARGLLVAPQRRKVLAAMRIMQAAEQAVERALTATQTTLAGIVRLTSTDTFCQEILPPILARLLDQAEALTIELNAANAHVSLAELDADIAIRPTTKLPPELVGLHAGQMGFAPYAAPSGTVPSSTAPSSTARWLGLSGALGRSVPARWMAEHVPEAEISARADSFLVLREMAAAGQGRVLLPTFLGDNDTRLVRLDMAECKGTKALMVDIWVASHRDMANVPRIRMVRELLAQALLQDAHRITGRSS